MDMDPTTSERVSEDFWKQLRDCATNPAIYFDVLRSNDALEGWEGIRSSLASQVQDGLVLVLVAQSILTWFWSSAAEKVPNPLFRILGPELYRDILKHVHARKEEWAATFLLSRTKAGLLTEADAGITEAQVTELRDYLIARCVTADFAMRIGDAWAKAEAAGEV